MANFTFPSIDSNVAEAVQAERNKMIVTIGRSIERAKANQEDLKARIVCALKHSPSDAADIGVRLRMEILVQERLEDLLEAI